MGTFRLVNGYVLTKFAWVRFGMGTFLTITHNGVTRLTKKKKNPKISE